MRRGASSTSVACGAVNYTGLPRGPTRDHGLGFAACELVGLLAGFDHHQPEVRRRAFGPSRLLLRLSLLHLLRLARWSSGGVEAANWPRRTPRHFGRRPKSSKQVRRDGKEAEKIPVTSYPPGRRLIFRAHSGVCGLWKPRKTSRFMQAVRR